MTTLDNDSVAENEAPPCVQTEREKHLAWAKERALSGNGVSGSEYVERGDLVNAYASMVSDIGKSEETKEHVGLLLGMQMMIAGHLSTERDMRHFIEGFN